MIIVAKFASFCPCCNASIRVGNKVEWSRGEKARCVGCAGKPAITRSVARTGSFRGSYRGRSGAGSAANVPGYSSYCTASASCGCYDCAS